MGDRWQDQDAEAWAATVVEVLRTPYPWISGHISTGPDDCDVTPAALHPAFHGAVDWHSSVHMQWSAVRLLTDARAELAASTRSALIAELDARLTPEHGATEAGYLRARPGYERPYGWAWAAMLAAQVRASPLPEAARWRDATRQVADAVAENLLQWLPRSACPVRHGVHSNTAFALALCHEAYTVLERPDVVAAISSRARDWFGSDRDYPARWEPSGEDFLSPALCEADLMRRVLQDDTADWLSRFLPELGAEDDPLLLTPVVQDPTDGRMVHLYGLALSRAWQLRLLAPYVADPEARSRIAAASTSQIDAARPHIVGGGIMATHWLVSFALLAVTADGR